MNTKTQASQRDELLQEALGFIATLTGMCPPPIEAAPPEFFAPFYDFVDRVQAITAPQPQANALGEVAELMRLSALCPELNTNNYGHEDVGLLNHWAVEVVQSIDRVAAAMPQADALDAARALLTVRLTSFPESNGKRNWTAMFIRTKPWKGLVGSAGGITIAHGELWNRVAYEAERARFLIGERDTEPQITDYGTDIQTPEEWLGEGKKRAAIAAAKGEL